MDHDLPFKISVMSLRFLGDAASLTLYIINGDVGRVRFVAIENIDSIIEL